MASDILDQFSPATAAWFRGSFAEPTQAQIGAWTAISSGHHALVVAPTGSGKTLSAFLWALDRLAAGPLPCEPRARCRVLYISPMKALAVDVERNLRSPLVGIRHAATRLGLPEPEITVAVRSGDTPADQRRAFARTPTDVLITTPESLFLLLTSAARESLTGIDTVIVDEIHALAGTKRGSHLALSLERLDALLERPAQRIGLSATVRPIEEVTRFLAGGRPVDVVAPESTKKWDLEVVVPVPDLAELGQPTGDLAGPAAGAVERTSIWPHVEERIVDLVSQHRSTLVFANSRRLAERLTARLNEVWQDRLSGEAAADEAEASERQAPAQVMAQSGASRGAPPVLARAHHGSVSKEQRAAIEEDLKAGHLPAVVATSSLELGIDMGAVDLVIQVESPPSVASGLQRVGRAGHQVGATSRGVLFPKFRGDLVQTAVVVERMRAGAIESLRVPTNPLDVLAQHIVAMVAMDDWTVPEVLALVRRSASFAALSESVLASVLDMLAGRYPSEEFAELRARLVWDRTTDTLSGRRGAQRLAVTSGGTIPDRGLYAVFLATGEGPGRRVGELDEEMVYESRVGDVFTLGTSTWRIEDITHDRVLVTPAPGQPGRLPFWKGDTLGRPAELGQAVGEFHREVLALPPDKARSRVKAAGLDEWAADNLLAYLADQRGATGHVPDDRTIVVERFRDELGDWRIAIHSPFGTAVHAPWALAIASRMRDRFGVEVQAMPGDDGIVLRLPDVEWEQSPDLTELIALDPEGIGSTVTDELGSSALFAARFRECAARALLLPKRQPGKRQPLWQQRQRAAQLLQVAAQFPSFPITLEAMRECVQDVFDLPGLLELLGRIQGREIRLIEVETGTPSPFARSLLFGYVAQFLYEGDSPLAERRAAALALDPGLLAELLGSDAPALRDLLDPQALAHTEAELQRLTPERACRDAEDVVDLLRALGPLPLEAIAARSGEARGEASTWVAQAVERREVFAVRVAGEERYAAVTDAARLRDALGVSLPVGVAQAFLEPSADPLGDLLRRFARTHGPFVADDVAAHFGLGVAVVHHGLARLVADGRLREGQFLPHRSGGGEYCDPEVLRVIRRRSLAALRADVEPVPTTTYARFLPTWQEVGTGLRGSEGLLRVVEQLSGAVVPASALETLVLPGRIERYTPALLDEALSRGDVLWCGHGSLPGDDGWVSLHLADTAAWTLPIPEPPAADSLEERVLAALGTGAFFFRGLDQALQSTDDAALSAAVWNLVWGGHVTGDTLAPLRALLSGGRKAHKTAARGPRSTRYAGRPGRPGLGLPRPALPSRSGPPEMAGRWSRLPDVVTDPTARTLAAAETLLDRHGVLTRGVAAAEEISGGFAGLYRVLARAEEAGRVRRGYFVETLGAAQFASAATIDRLRDSARLSESSAANTVVLAATDPANPYGAALPWPQRLAADGASKHQPGRKAGALVVVDEGHLILYVERGGRTLLSFTEDPQALSRSASALAGAIRAGALGRVTVEKADGAPLLGADHPLATALADAGFIATPRGLRARR